METPHFDQTVQCNVHPPYTAQGPFENPQIPVYQWIYHIRLVNPLKSLRIPWTRCILGVLHKKMRYLVVVTTSYKGRHTTERVETRKS